MKTYIIHVSDAYEREQHMQAQLKDKSLDVSFILDGDKNALTTVQINTYFKGRMASPLASTSCAMKHILACEESVKSGEELALVLEDDIRLYANFSKLEDIKHEIATRNLSNFMISLEDSDLRYVPRSQRKKNVLLYPQMEGRLAGAYLIDKKAAENMLNYIAKNKVDVPIDWFHTKCIREGLIQMYWSHPPLATQGSLDGSIESIIDKGKHGAFRPYAYAMQKYYKKMLYFFR